MTSKLSSIKDRLNSLKKDESWDFVYHIRFKDLYLISNHGRVYSIVSNRVLINQLVRGYHFVFLYSGSKKSKMKFLTHRLVAEAFIPNPDSKPHINHIDFNPTNNHFTNLEWCTPKENINHSITAKRFSRSHGEHHYMAKLSEKEVKEIRRLHSSGSSTHKLSAKYKVDRKTIREIITLKIWKHVL